MDMQLEWKTQECIHNFRGAVCGKMVEYNIKMDHREL
jgi:hypothetical protein